MRHLYSYQIPSVFIFLLHRIQQQESPMYKQQSDEILYHITNNKKVENESGKITLIVLFLKKIMKILSSIFQ